MRRITVPEEGIETLFGSYDENLKHLESLFNVRIRTQGHDLLVEGDAPDLEKVERVVGQLSSLMRDGYKLSNADDAAKPGRKPRVGARGEAGGRPAAKSFRARGSHAGGQTPRREDDGKPPREALGGGGVGDRGTGGGDRSTVRRGAGPPA